MCKLQFPRDSDSMQKKGPTLAAAVIEVWLRDEILSGFALAISDILAKQEWRSWSQVMSFSRTYSKTCPSGSPDNAATWTARGRKTVTAFQFNSCLVILLEPAAQTPWWRSDSGHTSHVSVKRSKGEKQQQPQYLTQSNMLQRSWENLCICSAFRWTFLFHCWKKPHVDTSTVSSCREPTRKLAETLRCLSLERQTLHFKAEDLLFCFQERLEA